jgi:hypothetical protein
MVCLSVLGRKNANRINNDNAHIFSDDAYGKRGISSFG